MQKKEISMRNESVMCWTATSFGAVALFNEKAAVDFFVFFFKLCTYHMIWTIQLYKKNTTTELLNPLSTAFIFTRS